MMPMLTTISKVVEQIELKNIHKPMKNRDCE